MSVEIFRIKEEGVDKQYYIQGIMPEDEAEANTLINIMHDVAKRHMPEVEYEVLATTAPITEDSSWRHIPISR